MTLVSATLREAVDFALVGPVHDVFVVVLVGDDFFRVFADVIQNVFLIGRKFFVIAFQILPQVLGRVLFWRLLPTHVVRNVRHSKCFRAILE